ncbi:MAG TPA: DNA polymerase I [Candidatus Tidjanibacter gallistercoris]|nr:DNA polymerase I [Candidatus Tidjanibacter gallistercoris]
MERLYLLDAYALIYRSYYAFMGRPMRNRQGINTSAVFGFTKFLRDILMKEAPRYMGVAFDPKGGTFRNELYPQYKANRSETPEDIVVAVPYIKRILAAMRIPCLEVPGYEADDVIGTLARKASEQGFEVYMVTPDKDFGQLIDRNVRIYKQRKGGEGVEVVGCEQLREQYGIDDPRLVIDILALWGDAADNIPGVPGIGEKSAVKLVNEFGTVENILAHADALKGKQKENILAGREQLLLSKRLATIETDVPIAFVPEELAMEDPDCDALREVYKELDFGMFLREMDGTRTSPFTKAVSGSAAEGPQKGGKTAPAPASGPAAAVQRDLFGNPVASEDNSRSAQETTVSESLSAGYHTVADTPHEYRTVTTPQQLADLIARLGTEKEFCFDVETSGFDCHTNRIVGISFSASESAACYVPISEGDREGFLAMLRPLLEEPSIAKIGQNIKFDIMALAAAGIRVAGFKYDTMILHYLLDPESRHGMNHLARFYLNYSPIEIETLIGRGSRQLTMDLVPLDAIAEYGAEDADVTLRLKNVLWPRIAGTEFERLYREIEEPLIDVLADIELTGVKIDTDRLAAYGRELSVEMDALEGRIRELAGTPDLNVNSSRQLGTVLFEKLRIDPKPKRTKTKQYSTDEEYLASLADRHPVVDMVLEYRGLKKLLSTYIDALPQLVNPVTGRVHTSFNQAVTATGRLSSTNPNLQNIPIRTEQGRQIRRAFVPSDSDHLLLSADYSQVELRLMAHLSGDEALIEAFRHGEDIHRATAARLFGIPLAEVTPEHRRKAKTANFGIIYGISAFGLKQRMGNITMEEAKRIIDGYFAAYPQVKEYMERVVAQARDTGYVETIFGRRRYLPDIRSANSVVRSLAERNAINAPIQGSAADIIKIAMNRIHRTFAERGIRSKVILQVHDELVVDMLRSEQEAVTTIVKECMEQAARLKVALVAECGVGENWLEAH